MQIGPHLLPNNIVLAPMAGVTDRPFRELCRSHGAGLAVGEMVTADTSLWGSRKSLRRLDHRGETAPVAVQIVGADPARLAAAARLNVANGAQIIDINMGCPAKKVCKVAAGSALLRDEDLVARILDSVVAAVDVPVTLKIRTGWEPSQRNGVRIAQIAEQAGIQMLAVHGRTRACGFGGQAEYATIRDICRAVRIPVLANGDIDSPQRAAEVLAGTGAAGIMIGRAAQGRPWLFAQIGHYLASGEQLPEPHPQQIAAIALQHIDGLYSLYGRHHGVRIARKHIAWYSRRYADSAGFRARVNATDDHAQQTRLVKEYFSGLTHARGTQAA